MQKTNYIQIWKKKATLCKKKGDSSYTWFVKPVRASIISAHKLEQDATQVMNRPSAFPLSTCWASLASATL